MVAEIARGIAPQAQPRHDGLRSSIVGGGTGDHLGEPATREGILQRRRRGLGRVALPPRPAHQPPADVDVVAEGMVRPRRHDAGVAEKLPSRLSMAQRVKP